MTKKPTRKAKPRAATPKRRVQYPCRCYKIGEEYEMWVLDPKSGTYRGPIPCTKEQCRACNMSAAEVVT